ncbi:MAG: hypothetical protein K6L73_14965 [Cellvibrionaceae bacterium]
MNKNSKGVIQFTIGAMLSIAFVIFLIEFVRGIDFEGVEYFLEVWPFLAISLILGSAGIPLVLFGIENVTSKNS